MAWLELADTSSAGHYACLKLYISYTALPHLFQNAPVHQFQYGEAVTCPFVHASIAGIRS